MKNILYSIIIIFSSNILFSQNVMIESSPKMSFEGELENREFVFYLIDNVIKQFEYDYLNGTMKDYVGKHPPDVLTMSSMHNLIFEKAYNNTTSNYYYNNRSEKLDGLGKSSYERFLKLKTNVTGNDLFEKYKKNNLLKFKLYRKLDNILENCLTEPDSNNGLTYIDALKEMRHNIFIEIIYFQLLTDSNLILIKDTVTQNLVDEKSKIRKIVIREYLENSNDADFVLVENKSDYAIVKNNNSNNLFNEVEYLFKDNSLMKINHYKSKFISKKKSSTSSYKALTPIGVAYGEVQYALKDRSYSNYIYEYEFHRYSLTEFNGNNILKKIIRYHEFDFFELNFNNNGVISNYFSNTRNFKLQNGLLYNKQLKDIDDISYTGQSIVFINDYTNIKRSFCDTEFKITNYSFENLMSTKPDSTNINYKQYFTEIVGGCGEGLLKVYYDLDENLVNNILEYMTLGNTRLQNSTIEQVGLTGNLDGINDFTLNSFFNGVDLHTGKLNDFGCYIDFIDDLEALSYGMAFEDFYESIKENILWGRFHGNDREDALKLGYNSILPLLKLGGYHAHSYQRKPREGLVYYGGNEYVGEYSWVDTKNLYGTFKGLNYKSTTGDIHTILFRPNFTKIEPANTSHCLHYINNNFNESKLYDFHYQNNGGKISIHKSILWLPDQIKEFKSLYFNTHDNSENFSMIRIIKSLFILKDLWAYLPAQSADSEYYVRNINSKQKDAETWPDSDLRGYDYTIYEYRMFNAKEIGLEDLFVLIENDNILVDSILDSDKALRIDSISVEEEWMPPLDLPLSEDVNFPYFCPHLYKTEFIKVVSHKDSTISNSWSVMTTKTKVYKTYVFINLSNYINSYFNHFLTSYESNIKDLIDKVNTKDFDENMLSDEEKSIWYWYSILDKSISDFEGMYLFRQYKRM
jgi:hypothetical protein